MQNELVCIRIKCLKDGGKTLESTKVIIESFESKINYVKEEKDLVPDDLSTIAKIKSLLFLCIGLLNIHSDKVAQVRREKEVWKKRMIHMGLLHGALIQDFSVNYIGWKNASTITTIEPN